MKFSMIYGLLRNRLWAITFSLMVALIAFSLTFLLSFYYSYSSYWNAIFRVQTVDFNMASHVFPSVLRSYIVEKDYQTIHTIVSSNFSLFKMAVDVCVDSPCTDFKEVAVNDNKSSGDRIDIPIFKSANMPTFIKFEHSYSLEPIINSYDDQELVGRLRLYRGLPPSFIDDLWSFSKRILSSQESPSRYTAYFSNLFFSIFFALFVFLFLILVRNYLLEQEMRKSVGALLRHRILKNHG